jgi:hypothetical protein
MKWVDWMTAKTVSMTRVNPLKHHVNVSGTCGQVSVRLQISRLDGSGATSLMWPLGPGDSRRDWLICHVKQVGRYDPSNAINRRGPFMLRHVGIFSQPNHLAFGFRSSLVFNRTD